MIVIPGPNTGGPVFSKDTYEVQVSEGASVGSAVATLKVTLLVGGSHAHVILYLTQTRLH